MKHSIESVEKRLKGLLVRSQKELRYGEGDWYGEIDEVYTRKGLRIIKRMLRLMEKYDIRDMI